MVVVTGTKRAGTSLWMRALQRAGLDVLGEPFPGVWRQSIGAANPGGFHESYWRQGVWDGTNPHPKTGERLLADATRTTAIKIFVPGVLRTDRVFLDHVLLTVRPWWAVGPSLQRLYAMEDAWAARQPDADARRARYRRLRSRLPAPVSWLLDHHALLHDARARGYPLLVTTVDQLQRDRLDTMRRVCAFLGRGDAVAAAEVVDHRLPPARPVTDAWTPAEQAVLDELYACFDAGGVVSDGLHDRMEGLVDAWTARFGGLDPQAGREGVGDFGQ